MGGGSAVQMALIPRAMTSSEIVRATVRGAEKVEESPRRTTEIMLEREEKNKKVAEQDMGKNSVRAAAFQEEGD